MIYRNYLKEFRMESQSTIDRNFPGFSDYSGLTVEIIDQRLNFIYNEILSIEEEDPSIKFNKNISFINKLMRGDRVFIEVLKCMKLGDSILNNKKLSPIQINQISLGYFRLKNELISIKNILKTTSNLAVFYKAIAAASYYTEFHLNKLVETVFGNYIIGSVIENTGGLRAIYFEPTEKNMTPILSIRGTVAGIRENVLDDLHWSIGTLSFEAGREELLSLLTTSYQKFSQGCLVVGHSLGGAIAQQIVAAFGKDGLISQVYHYNSPGVGLAVVNQFIKNCEESDFQPEIIEVRHENDLVSYFGGVHLPAKNRVLIKDEEKTSYGSAHEILKLMEKCHLSLVHFETEESPEELLFWRGRYNYFTVETLRWGLAPILRLIVWSSYPSEKPHIEVACSEVEEVSQEKCFLEKHKF